VLGDPPGGLGLGGRREGGPWAAALAECPRHGAPTGELWRFESIAVPPSAGPVGTSEGLGAGGQVLVGVMTAEGGMPFSRGSVRIRAWHHQLPLVGAGKRSRLARHGVSRPRSGAAAAGCGHQALVRGLAEPAALRRTSTFVKRGASSRGRCTG
jgi:hypothetical protein